MANIITQPDMANRADNSVPTNQMNTFLRQTGIDPQKYGEINAKAESVKNMLDEQLKEYRRQKAIAR